MSDLLQKLFLNVGRGHTFREDNQVLNSQEADGILIIGLKSTVNRQSL